jgi:serine phosphatase RsbU (regulator of sigma subunit)
MQSRFQSHKWQNRLIAWSVLPAMAILIGVAIYTFMAYRQAVTTLVIERDRQVAILSAARLKVELSKFSDVLTTLSRNQDIYSSDPATQQAALNQASNLLNVFDGGVVVLNHFGKVQANQPYRPELLGQDWSGHDFFIQSLGAQNTVFSDILQDGPDSSSVVAIGVPILNEKGEFVGVIAGLFRLGQPTISAFYASIVRLRIGQSGNTYLIDSSHEILYDSGSNQAGESVDGQWDPMVDFNEQPGAQHTRDMQNHDVVVAFTPIPETGWILVTEDDWNILTSSIRGFVNNLMILLALGMILPAGAITLLLRQRNLELMEREQIERESHVAYLIQNNILPKQVPVLPGWNIAVCHKPNLPIGGDFYDFVLLPDGHLILTIGKVYGSGVTAAITSSTTHAILRGAVQQQLPPAKALFYCNNSLSPEIPPDTYVNCLFASLEPSKGILEFSNAGKLFPYHSNNNGITELQLTGSALGMALNINYEETRVGIGPGEFIFFYSNGLTELKNRSGDEFGPERLKAVLTKLRENNQDPVETVLSELHEFGGKTWDQQDDITFIVLERLSKTKSSH